MDQALFGDGFDQIPCGPFLYGLRDCTLGAVGRDHDDPGLFFLTDPQFAFDAANTLQGFVSSHIGHHDVQTNEIISLIGLHC